MKHRYTEREFISEVKLILMTYRGCSLTPEEVEEIINQHFLPFPGMWEGRVLDDIDVINLADEAAYEYRTRNERGWHYDT